MIIWARLKNLDWRIMLAGISAVVVLHILTTLVSPSLIPRDGLHYLGQNLGVNRMVVLPPVAPGAQRIPFMSADGRYAVCNFDSSNGRVSIKVNLSGAGWYLAVYSSAGDNVLTIVAQPGKVTSVSLALIAHDDRLPGDSGPTQAAQRNIVEQSTLSVPVRRGLVIIKAPDDGLAYASQHLNVLNNAICEPQRL